MRSISQGKRAAHARIYFVPGAMRKTVGLSHNGDREAK